MNNKAQFTPGPWKAVPDKSKNMYTWYVEGAKGVVPTIARLSLIDACEEIESNAHLIAAAPAMYEALQHAAMSYHHPACKCKGEYSANPERYCTCHVQKAWAALAQAEGK